MAKLINKWLAGLLAAIMLVGMLPMSAFAVSSNTDGNDRPGDKGTTAITVVVRDASDNAKFLEGAGVRLERVTSGRYRDYGTQYTDETGTVVWNNLEAGLYRVTQTYTLDGYKMSTYMRQGWFGTEDSNHTVDITNYPEVTLTVVRLANGKPVEGSKFVVRDTDGGEIFNGTTDENGVVKFGAIAPGDYTVTEESRPSDVDVPYDNPQSVHISTNQQSDITLLFESTKRPNLIINYREAETGLPVVGGRFTLTKTDAPSSVISTEIITDDTGVAVYGPLAPGDYTISQTHVPDGYIDELNSSSFTVNAESDGAIIRNFYADRPGSVTFHVLDSLTGKPIPGVEITLYSQGNQVAGGPLTTNAEGRVTFGNLASGNYSAVITGVPEGYTMDLTTMPVFIEPNKNLDLNFTATIKASLTIYAQDEQGNALSNCEFVVYRQNGTKVGEVTTSASGSAMLTNLDPGYYVIEQVSAPDGYVITDATKSVRVIAGQMAEQTFICRSTPYIVVYGNVVGTSAPVPGATYQLWDATNTQVLQTKVADNDGAVLFEDLTPGTYVVRCIAVPAGYTLNSGAQTVSVSAIKAGVANFVFDKHSSIVVKALDDDGHPISDAIFQIRNENGQVVEQITTDISGTAVTDTLDPGRYTIEQLFAPDGYVPNTYFQTILVENNKTALATFTQTQKSVITIYATDSEAMGLAGVQYAVYDAVTGLEVAQVVTDESGVATVGPLAPGVYTVKELSAPDGYLLTTSYQVPVVMYGDEAVYVRFPHATQDYILIETLDSVTRAPIPGAQYTVTNMNNDLVGTYTANDNGVVEVGPLTPGFYVVKQVAAPEGYSICTETQTIEVISGRVLNCRFVNEKLEGIIIEAVDQATHVGLPNVTFEIYNDKNIQVFHGVTNTSGQIATGELPAGRYTIRQMATPDGYTAVETMKNITLGNESVTVVFEQKAHTSLIIELVDDTTGAPLSGSRFRVEAVDGTYTTTVVTGEDGTVIVSGLPAGRYMVAQETAPEGYVQDSSYQWAEIKQGADTSLRFTNKAISGLVIRAFDRDTQEPLAGATFEISEVNGKLVKTVTTDNTGIVTITGLNPGEYLVRETKGPEGYQIDTVSQTVTITTEANSTLTFNHVANANLTLRAIDAKAGNPIAGVIFRVEESDGTYVGEYVTGASGLVSLAAAAPGKYHVSIVDVPDGYLIDRTAREVSVPTNEEVVETFVIDQESGATIRVIESQTGLGVEDVTLRITTLDGTFVGNFTTDRKGFIFTDLRPGEYMYYITYGPDGYELDAQPHNFTVKANVETVIELDIEKESHLRIQVVDAATDKGVYNVKIELVDQYNNYVGQYTTNDEGYIYLDQVMKSGRYKATMLEVPSGYIKDSVPKTIEISLDETTDVKWEISGQQGQVTITTLSDADNILMGIAKGSRLQGAVYQITNMSGQVVATIYGDSYGEAHSGALGLGTYYVQQIQAPAGYMLNSQRVTINVTSLNDDIKITVYNKSGNFKTTVSAHGPRTVAPNNQAKFYYTNVSNASTTTVANFFLHIKVPTDGARAGTFYTGTWGGTATTFRVEYKTNMSDYRVLASGLNSKSQYSYDMSSIALGLASGEYVTDIRMVFDRATAGMKESMAPVLYVTVLPNVANGYQLINRAETGCQGEASSSVSSGNSWSANTGLNGIAGGWTSATAQSTTVVTGPTYTPYPLPSTLPKTGY